MVVVVVMLSEFGEMGFSRSDGGSKVAHKTTNDIRRFASRKTFCSLGFLAPVDWISSFKLFLKNSSNFFLEPFS